MNPLQLIAQPFALVSGEPARTPREAIALVARRQPSEDQRMAESNEDGRGQNIADVIFRDLRRQILAGEIQAGQRLPGERELATKYGTNRNTLREAVRKLEQMRLVTVRHGQGVTVTDFRQTGTMELLAPFFEATNDYVETSRILFDVLPARVMVLDFLTRLAVERADEKDIERLNDISELLTTAFEKGDAALIGRGFNRYLEALIDACHSTAARWIANPFLGTYRELLDRFPGLWVLDPSFPGYVKNFTAAVSDSDLDRAMEVNRNYYERIDAAFAQVLKMAIAQPAPKPPQTEPEPTNGQSQPASEEER